MMAINFAGTSFAYFLTCFFTSTTAGLFVFFGLYIVMVTVSLSAGLVDAFSNVTSPFSTFIQYSLKFVPTPGFVSCLNAFFPTAIINSRCNFVPKFIKNMTCNLVKQNQYQDQDQLQKEWTKISNFCCGTTPKKKLTS